MNQRMNDTASLEKFVILNEDGKVNSQKEAERLVRIQMQKADKLSRLIISNFDKARGLGYSRS